MTHRCATAVLAAGHMDDTRPAASTSTSTCYLCFGGGELISSCRFCVGSVRFIHEDCIRDAVKTMGLLVCPTCKKPLEGGIVLWKRVVIWVMSIVLLLVNMFLIDLIVLGTIDLVFVKPNMAAFKFTYVQCWIMFAVCISFTGVSYIFLMYKEYLKLPRSFDSENPIISSLINYISIFVTYLIAISIMTVFFYLIMFGAILYFSYLRSRRFFRSLQIKHCVFRACSRP